MEYEHLGADLDFGSVTLEARAEVGLLSHNVKFRGNDDIQWHDEIQACEEGFDPGS